MIDDNPGAATCLRWVPASWMFWHQMACSLAAVEWTTSGQTDILCSSGALKYKKKYTKKLNSSIIENFLSLSFFHFLLGGEAINICRISRSNCKGTYHHNCPCTFDVAEGNRVDRSYIICSLFLKVICKQDSFLVIN